MKSVATVLGKDQRGALRSLMAHNSGRWTTRCGWVWGNNGGTSRILRSMVKYGLVEEEASGDGYGTFVITPAGVETVLEWRQERKT
jgi:hypothetical protein